MGKLRALLNKYMAVPLLAGALALPGCISAAQAAQNTRDPDTGLEQILDKQNHKQLQKLSRQTGQTMEAYIRLTISLKDIKYEGDKRFEEGYETRTATVSSLDNSTVMIPKPKDGEFDNDLYIRVNEGEVDVNHYNKRHELWLDDTDNNGLVDIALWDSEDAFGVYNNSEGEKEGLNLLVDQNISVADNGNLILRTQALGEDPKGNYKVTVSYRYRKLKPEPPKDMRNARPEHLAAALTPGAASGSLTHVYSGIDPLCDDSCEELDIFLSNHHTFDSLTDLAKKKIHYIWEGRGKDKRLVGAYMYISANAMAKFDENDETKWVPMSFYRGMHDEDLDVSLVQPLIPGKINKDMPVAKFAREDPVVGEPVTIVGHPLGVTDRVVNARGIVADEDHGSSSKDDMILVYGDIVGGNSGGGAYNGDGEFIGIPTATYVSRYYIESEDRQEGLAEYIDINSPEVKSIDFSADLEGSMQRLADLLVQNPEIKKKADELAQDLTPENIEAMVTAKEQAQSKEAGSVAVRQPLGLVRKASSIKGWLQKKGINMTQDGSRITPNHLHPEEPDSLKHPENIDDYIEIERD
ncbi:serine protease [Thermoproteota archaeon]